MPTVVITRETDNAVTQAPCSPCLNSPGLAEKPDSPKSPSPLAAIPDKRDSAIQPVVTAPITKRAWRLPAYGRALLKERRDDIHPREVAVVFGDDWRGIQAPRLCVKPAEFRLGRFDWSMLAGLHARVIDRSDLHEELFWLISEIVIAGAWVTAQGGAGADTWEHRADQLAYAYRVLDTEKRCMRWPLWWSDRHENLHNELWADWMLDRGREQGLCVDEAQPSEAHGRK